MKARFLALDKREAELKEALREVKKEREELKNNGGVALRAACYEGNLELVKSFIEEDKISMTESGYSGAYYEKKDVIESEKYGHKYPGDVISNAIQKDRANVLKYFIDRSAESVCKQLKDFTRRDPEKFTLPSVNSIATRLCNVLEKPNGYYEPCLFTLKLPYNYNPEYAPKIKHENFADRRQSLLIEAIAWGSIECVKLLVNEYKANPDMPFIHTKSQMIGYSRTKQGSALGYAIDRGETEIALFLINQAGVKLDTPYGNKYQMCSERYGGGGYSETMDWDKERKSSPLLRAAELNNVAVVKALLEHGATPRGEQLTTNPDIKKLIEEAKLNAGKGPSNMLEKMQGSLSAAINAGKKHNQEAITLIKVTGMDVNAPCGNTYTGPGFWNKERHLTPLALAIQGNNVALVKELVRGCHAKVTKNDIAMTNNVEIIKFLENYLPKDNQTNSSYRNGRLN